VNAEVNMRALFTVADGGYSHLYPLLPLARELKNRGHAVTVVAPDRLSTLAERFDVDAIRLPVSRRAGAGHPGGSSGPSVRRARTAVGRYLSDAVEWTGFLSATAREWGADVLVRESAAWSGWLVGDLLGLPVALFDYAPTPPRLLAMTLGDLFNAARADVGLPPDPDLLSLTRWLHLLAGPPGWFPARSIGAATHILGPPPPLAGEHEPPAWMEEFDGSRPCVYVTLGTMFDRSPGVFEMIFEAVADEPIRVVASLGPGGDPGRFPQVPPNVRLESFMPQAVEAAVLARSDAVICHGGYGSILAAMRHGLPIVSIPAGNADDPTRLPGIEAMGLALVIPEHRRSVAAVRDALGAVLRDPAYRSAAARTAGSLAALPPFLTAAGLIERLAVERRPILRTGR
jgi:UDP:flavonoid glycosyltransferase YjiC (YdhE family)